MMAMRLPLAAGTGARLVRDNPWRPTWPARGAEDNETDLDHGSFLREARPVLRVVATMAAIALVGYAAVVVALLTLLRAL